MKPVSEKDFKDAVSLIRSGGMVALPTETYYGLAVDPFNPAALKRLFLIKQRVAQKPILLIIDNPSSLEFLVKEVPDVYRPVMETQWPGPVTLVFKAKEELSSLLTGNTGTVGVRCSSHPVARKLVEMIGSPVTATSANISGLPAAVSAQEVVSQLGGSIDMVLDGGRTPGEKGSTIIGYRGNKVYLIREGVVPFSEIEHAE